MSTSPGNTHDRFVETYNELIHRTGSDKLLEWLEKSDFFTAPASTRFHLASEGGLVTHSLNVFDQLMKLYEFTYGKEPDGDMKSSLAIMSLLHDVCKVNFYKLEMRNRKNESGQWESYPTYAIEDSLPYGHGEKSVYILSGFIKLTREEAMAIRFHMGFSSPEFKGGDQSVGKAFEMYPLAMLLHEADMRATYLMESEGAVNG